MKFNTERVVALYQRKGCNVSATCIAAGISRAMFYRKLKDNKKFAKAIEEAQEAIIDNVESKLLSKINDGDTTSIIFFLKTKGKKRGYIEKVEQDIDLTSKGEQVGTGVDVSGLSEQALKELVELRNKKNGEPR